ncbi:hypothetical protein HDU76_012850 [Blyttiomyces sp. JEL0837]|nr:hypothetical protein HDU76_012850 [Blyttiomyces sp. JEL0837]
MRILLLILAALVLGSVASPVFSFLSSSKNTNTNVNADRVKKVAKTNEVANFATNDANPLPATYLGCIDHLAVSDWFFPETADVGPDMSIEVCLSFCTNKGFAYFGTLYGNSCLCGNHVPSSMPSSQCDLPCSGNPSQVCGGKDYGVSLYWLKCPTPESTKCTIDTFDYRLLVCGNDFFWYETRCSKFPSVCNNGYCIVSSSATTTATTKAPALTTIPASTLTTSPTSIKTNVPTSTPTTISSSSSETESATSTTQTLSSSPNVSTTSFTTASSLTTSKSIASSTPTTGSSSTVQSSTSTSLTSSTTSPTSSTFPPSITASLITSSTTSKSTSSTSASSSSSTSIVSTKSSTTSTTSTTSALPSTTAASSESTTTSPADGTTSMTMASTSPLSTPSPCPAISTFPQTPSGQTASAACLAGQSGTQEATCTNGVWSPADTTNCLQITCASSNGFPTTNAGQNATIPCPSGRPGSQTAKCSIQGIWLFPDTSNCNGGKYWGCFADFSDGNSTRSMSFGGVTGTSISNDICVAHCTSLGYAFSGTQNGNQCFCGDEYPADWSLDGMFCNSPCTGQPSQICGGTSAVSVTSSQCSEVGASKCSGGIDRSKLLTCNSDGFWALGKCQTLSECVDGQCVWSDVIAVYKDITVNSQSAGSPSYASMYCEGPADQVLDVSDRLGVEPTSVTVARRRSAIDPTRIVPEISQTGLVIDNCTTDAIPQTVYLYCHHTNATSDCSTMYDFVQVHAIISLHKNCAGGYFARVESVVEVPALQDHVTTQDSVKMVELNFDWGAYNNRKNGNFAKRHTSETVAFVIEMHPDQNILENDDEQNRADLQSAFDANGFLIRRDSWPEPERFVANDNSHQRLMRRGCAWYDMKCWYDYWNNVDTGNLNQPIAYKTDDFKIPIVGGAKMCPEGQQTSTIDVSARLGCTINGMMGLRVVGTIAPPTVSAAIAFLKADTQIDLGLNFDARAGASYGVTVPILPQLPLIAPFGVPNILLAGAYVKVDSSFTANFELHATSELKYSYSLPPIDVMWGFDHRDGGTNFSSLPINPSTTPGKASGPSFNAGVTLEGIVKADITPSLYIALDIFGGQSTSIGIHGEAGLIADIYGVASASAALVAPSYQNGNWSAGSVSIDADVSVGANVQLYAIGEGFGYQTPRFALTLFDTGDISIWNYTYSKDIPVQRRDIEIDAVDENFDERFNCSLDRFVEVYVVPAIDSGDDGTPLLLDFPWTRSESRSTDLLTVDSVPHNSTGNLMELPKQATESKHTTPPQQQQNLAENFENNPLHLNDTIFPDEVSNFATPCQVGGEAGVCVEMDIAQLPCHFIHGMFRKGGPGSNRQPVSADGLVPQSLYDGPFTKDNYFPTAKGEFGYIGGKKKDGTRSPKKNFNFRRQLGPYLSISPRNNINRDPFKWCKDHKLTTDEFPFNNGNPAVIWQGRANALNYMIDEERKNEYFNSQSTL